MRCALSLLLLLISPGCRWVADYRTSVATDGAPESADFALDALAHDSRHVDGNGPAGDGSRLSDANGDGSDPDLAGADLGPIGLEETHPSSKITAVPTGYTKVTVHAWGGGGGGGFANAPYGGNDGAGGGYVSQTLSVSAGEAITIKIGGGGVGGSCGGTGGAGGYPGGVGGYKTSGGDGKGSGSGGAGGAALPGTGYSGGKGGYGGGGGGGGGGKSGAYRGGGGGSATVVSLTRGTVLIAGGGGGGGARYTERAGNGGPGCGQPGEKAPDANAGGGGGGGACVGAIARSGAGRQPAESLRAGSHGEGAMSRAGPCDPTLANGRDGLVILEYRR